LLYSDKENEKQTMELVLDLLYRLNII